MAEYPVEFKFEITPTPFGTVGFCQTFGTEGAALIAGIGAATLVLLLSLAFNLDWKTALLVTLLSGGTVGTITYFTCKGVEAGVPIALR